MPGKVINMLEYKTEKRVLDPGVRMQLAAEAGSETKRLIEADPNAINGPHREIVVNGLRLIARGEYGSDYHSITPAEAEDILNDHEWPVEAAN